MLQAPNKSNTETKLTRIFVAAQGAAADDTAQLPVFDNWSAHVLKTREEFRDEITKPDDAVCVVRAAALVAKEQYPALNVDHVIDELDGLGCALRARMQGIPRYPLKMIPVVNDYMFNVLGFAANTADFDDPRNSFMNQVLERRTGNTITLAIVYMELAKRIGLPMFGAAAPRHFLLRTRSRPVPDAATPAPHGLPPVAAASPASSEAESDSEIFVDAFNKGEVLYGWDVYRKLGALYHWFPNDPPLMNSAHLAPIGAKAILRRLLNNLKLIYFARADSSRALAMCHDLVLLDPTCAELRRDRGLSLYDLEMDSLAQPDLEMYVQSCPHAHDAAYVMEVLRSIRIDRRGT